MDCRQVEQHLDAYADGELEPSAVVGFDAHLTGCAECAGVLRLLRATKQAVHAQLSGVRAPASLHLRVGRALDRVDGRESPMRRWGTVAMAVAAAALLGLSQLSQLRPGHPGVAGASEAGMQAGLTPIFEDVVERHRDDLPSEVGPSESPERVTGWFRDKVAFRVAPVRFARPEVQLLGARMSHVRSQRAAQLVYRLGDRRVTMIVFPSTPELKPYLERDQDGSAVGIRRERIGDRVITYYTVKNYTVPIVEHDGIAYAFTGDLDRSELLQLVGSAKLP
jgi:anti-sigma factor RsiW